jgi:hypothetical protein
MGRTLSPALSWARCSTTKADGHATFADTGATIFVDPHVPWTVVRSGFVPGSPLTQAGRTRPDRPAKNSGVSVHPARM